MSTSRILRLAMRGLLVAAALAPRLALPAVTAADWANPLQKYRARLLVERRPESTVALDKGVPRFEYCHVEVYGGQAAVAGWKKQRDKSLTLIPAEAFVPISRVRILRPEGAEGRLLDFDFKPGEIYPVDHETPLIAIKFRAGGPPRRARQDAPTYKPEAYAVLIRDHLRRGGAPASDGLVQEAAARFSAQPPCSSVVASGAAVRLTTNQALRRKMAGRNARGPSKRQIAFLCHRDMQARDNRLSRRGFSHY